MATKTSISCPGKWILAGEHSVLRGYRAIALPRTDLCLTFEFESMPAASEKSLIVTPEQGMTAMSRILPRALALIGNPKSKEHLAGRLHISGNIPYGAGLGSSAAFCLLTLRWLSEQLSLSGVDLMKMATELENEFHGKSSGIDVATLHAGEPIGVRLTPEPSRTLEFRKLGLKAIPKFSFHDTGLRCSTRICVDQVQALQTRDPKLATKLDQDMDHAAENAESGLHLFSEGKKSQGLAKLVEAMNLAQSCFQSWDLVPPQAAELIARLKKEGAMAAKLTGSGGGGMVVALHE